MNNSSCNILKGSIPVRNTVNSLAVFGLYCAILLNRIMVSSFASLLWYVLATICVVLAILADRGNISAALLVFFSLCWITGALNIAFVGNYSLRKLIFALMSIGIARLLVDKSISTSVIKWALYLNVLYVLLRFATRGLFMDVYVNASNNYVSIQIIQCVVIYYALVEARGEALEIMPALIAFVVTVASQGRGGIVAMGIMFIGLLICKRENAKSKYVKWQYSYIEVIIGISIALMALMAALLLVRYISSVNPNESVFRKFHNLGMSGNGRSAIWSEYINIVSRETKYYFWGGKLNLSPFLQSYNLNLHNSFLEIHAYNGIIMLVAVCIMLGNTVVYGVRNKRPIIIICLLTICIRGGLDQMLWATTGMPFFVFFLIYPMLIDQEQTSSYIIKSFLRRAAMKSQV